jgi:hypothetical protein
MKFIRRQKNQGRDDAFVFQLSKRDRSLLLSVLKLFPVTDPKSHRLSKMARLENKANQELLVEAMEEQRRGHAAKIDRLLKNQPQFFQESEGIVQFMLNGEQIEWLLQALNDIRVGSWTRLGCPEMAEARRAVLTEESAAHYTAMELSGYFESALLEAFRSEAM